MKDIEQARFIANSYDGDTISIEDMITACMGMARWKQLIAGEWLKENLYHYIGFESVHDAEIKDAINLIISDFNKAMESNL